MKSDFSNLFSAVKNRCYQFRKNQNGVTAIEYSLIAVAVTTLVVLVLFYNEGSVIKAYAEKFAQLTKIIQAALSDV
ncbi:pilus assembly protein Flp/PilA [Pasteurella testudinis DSM 23072]|uniref:Pilus assembly protein Flp/PilA n=1 Tax=Pasteurella testudinis DSM 23072 TaxID=1122938 RepID=A0A1W1UD40_9PAST|nr:Flp family type IVb pilin [Pasteurella testudinis]SMB78932.1 pilus assembly protein Flp/PilA [Pasteurella testudinis DSM 23072]SUB52457.1 flp operon protein Flp1 [Pasteurella testudinis]